MPQTLHLYILTAAISGNLATYQALYPHQLTLLHEVCIILYPKLYLKMMLRIKKLAKGHIAIKEEGPRIEVRVHSCSLQNVWSTHIQSWAEPHTTILPWKIMVFSTFKELSTPFILTHIFFLWIVVSICICRQRATVWEKKKHIQGTDTSIRHTWVWILALSHTRCVIYPEPS